MSSTPSAMLVLIHPIEQIPVQLETPSCATEYPETERTLRAAIEFINNKKIGTRINIFFDIPDVSTAVIQPSTVLPTILYPINLKGATQPGADFVVLAGGNLQLGGGLILEAGNSNLEGLTIRDFKGNGLVLRNNGYSTIRDCEFLDSKLYPNTGLMIDQSSNNKVEKCLVSGNNIGLLIKGNNAAFNIIDNNKIGTNVYGTLPNSNVYGVILDGACNNNEIKNNVISGNGVGVEIANAYANNIGNNKIGTNVTGNQALPNLVGGISIISGDSKNEIQNNTISGNRDHGISLHAFSKIIIRENRIGTDITNTFPVPNSRSGIYIERVETNDVQIEKNTISGNGENGIEIFGGYGNKITNKNVIMANGKNGILIRLGDFNLIEDNTISGNQDNGILVDHARGNNCLQNRIGTDASGIEPFGNTADGIKVVNGIHENIIKGNLISANQCGISVQNSESDALVYIDDNQVGGNIFGENINGEMGNYIGVNIEQSKTYIENNQLLYNEKGITINDGFNSKIHTNDILYNNTGIEVNGKLSSIQGNNILANMRGIDVIDSGDEAILIANNDVEDNTGSGTGIHLNNSKATIRGNQITGDAGDAITLENGSSADVIGNNIFDNQGFGLNNLNPSILANASSNWWGDPGGPGGAGSGLGNPVSSGVDFSNWRFRPVDVVVSAEDDTLILPTGVADTISFFLQNWVDRDDVLNVSISESRDWVTSPANFSVPLLDKRTAVVPLAIMIPPGTPDGTQATVNLTATSQSDNFNFANTSVIIISQAPKLSSIIVSPDSVTISPGDSINFTATGYDQFNSTASFSPIWNASGGSIDTEGKFIAPSDTNIYVVTATDQSGLIAGEAIVIVTLITSVDENLNSTPTAFSLFQNYPNPFNPTTTIRYEIPDQGIVTLKIYDVLGREVSTLVNQTKNPGNYEIKFNGTSLSSGVYLYVLKVDKFVSVKRMLLIK